MLHNVSMLNVSEKLQPPSLLIAGRAHGIAESSVLVVERNRNPSHVAADFDDSLTLKLSFPHNQKHRYKSGAQMRSC